MNCTYCFNKYTLKGIKRHYLFCKVKKEVEKHKKYDDEKIKINYDEYKIANKNDYFNNIPEDCIRIIFDFYNGKDEFTTSKRAYRNLFRVAITCKRLYKIFNPPHTLYKMHLNELKSKLYLTTAKKIYKLTYDDLKDIKYKEKYMYQNYCKLYSNIDILDKCLDKYGSHKNFENILNQKKIKKENSKKMSNILKDDRLEKYNNLFNKHDLIYTTIYYEFLNYVNYGTPALSVIETELKNLVDKRERFELLNNLLNENNLKYESNKISDNYINTAEYTLEEAYQTIFEINKRKNDLIIIYDEHNINPWTELNYSFSKEYVYENIYEYNEIRKIIIGRHTRFSMLKSIIKKLSAKIKNENIMYIDTFKKYVDEGIEQEIHAQNVVEKYISKNTRTELLIKELKNKGIKYYPSSTIYYKYIIDESCNIDDIINEINNLKSFYKNTNYYKNYIFIKCNYKINHIDNAYYAKLMTINNTYIEELNTKYDTQNSILKCVCNNPPSTLCGYCNSCCMHEYCIRHK